MLRIVHTKPEEALINLVRELMTRDQEIRTALLDMWRVEEMVGETSEQTDLILYYLQTLFQNIFPVDPKTHLSSRRFCIPRGWEADFFPFADWYNGTGEVWKNEIPGRWTISFEHEATPRTVVVALETNEDGEAIQSHGFVSEEPIRFCDATIPSVIFWLAEFRKRPVYYLMPDISTVQSVVPDAYNFQYIQYP